MRNFRAVFALACLAALSGSPAVHAQGTAPQPTVHVLGVSLPNIDPTAWWTADGRKLAGNLLSDHAFIPADATPNKGKQIARIMLEVQGVTPADDDRIMVVNAGGYSSQSMDRTDGSRLILLQVDFPAATPTGDIRCGIASRLWQDVAVAVGNGSTSTNGTIDGADGNAPIDVIFSETFPYEKGSAIVVSTTLTDRDTRIVGLDAQGHLVTPQIRSRTAINALEQRTGVFSTLTPGDLKMVKLQGRSYQWTELKDIALQPAP